MTRNLRAVDRDGAPIAGYVDPDLWENAIPRLDRDPLPDPPVLDREPEAAWNGNDDGDPA